MGGPFISYTIEDKKNDYRVGYQDSHHNIRYIDHSTAKKEVDTFIVKKYTKNTNLFIKNKKSNIYVLYL